MVIIKNLSKVVQNGIFCQKYCLNPIIIPRRSRSCCSSSLNLNLNLRGANKSISLKCLYVEEALSKFQHSYRSFSNNTATGTEYKCWKCGGPITESIFNCPCGAMQDLSLLSEEGKYNFFDIFEFPQVFHIDMEKLELQFKSLQKLFHPDLHGQKSMEEQAITQNNSSLINQGYNILKNPIKRAKYILKLHGIDVLGETSASNVDMDILMEVVELREAIETATDKKAIESLIAKNDINIEKVIKKIGIYHDDKKFDLMANEAVRLQYLTKVDFEANEKYDELSNE